MKLGLFHEVAAHAEARMNQGWTIYQQWTSRHCGSKQTMPDADKFYTLGRCEECKRITNIKAMGCNFMATKSAPGSGIADIISDL